MYDTERLNELIDDYLNHCEAPTKKGLAIWLCTSPSTINNVIRGFYNHKPYGLVPHSTRVIDNKDFTLIRSLFKAERTEDGS